MIVLVLGGTRSGKTAVAQRIAAALPAPVTYVATGVVTDDGMAARVAAHRAARPAGWTTCEVGPGDDLPAAVRAVEGTVLVDSLGTWVAGWWREDGRPAPQGARAAGEALAGALAARAGDAVAVGEEVGLSVHPVAASGRWFVDALGEVNEALAARADHVLLVVAGRVLALPAVPPPEVPGLGGPGADG